MSFASFICSLIRHGPNIMLYPGAFEPRPREVRLPSAYSLPYEDLTLTTSDRVKIRAYLLLQPDTKGKKRESNDTTDKLHIPTVLMFHGNMDNIGYTLPLASIFYHRTGCNVMMLSPRGYGLSEGRPSTKGLKRDCDAALDYISTDPRLSNSPIILYGQSMGAALATDLAGRHSKQISALIVENTFTSLRKLIPEVMPLFSCTAPFFRQWNSLARIRKLPDEVAVLLLSGQEDEIIGAEHMRRLGDAAFPPGSKRFGRLVCFPEGHHNDTWDLPGYWDAIAEFIESLPYDDDPQ